MPKAESHPFLLLAALAALVTSQLACNYPAAVAARQATAAASAVGTDLPATLPPLPPHTPPPVETPGLEVLPPGPETAAPADPSASQPAPTPTIAYTPVFEPGDCRFSVPPGTRPECGDLLVPEDRTRPGSPTLRLHVAVFRSQAAQPAPDPVVYLSGGPGSSALDSAGYLFSVGLDAVLARRDFILFDQRGTGASQPRLDCPERENLTAALLEKSRPPDELAAAVGQAFRDCRQRWEQAGVDLAAYNSAASAADVNDLRLALGYDQLNLYGVSYGTRLALTVLRDYPEAVRSAVLDSVYPLEENLYIALPANAERAFEVLFARCAADPTCQAAYPDLEAVFYALVDQLNAGPRPVTLTAGGQRVKVWVDGGLLIDVLFVGLYNPQVAASMPAMIYQLQNGQDAIFRQRLALYFDFSGAEAMQMAVQCGEELAFGSPEAAFLAAQPVEPRIAGFFLGSYGSLSAVCQDWGLPAPDPKENQPVVTGRPVLALGGEFDPITPPDWGRQVAQASPNAHFFEFPGNGHWVTRSSACAQALALAFWDDPSAPPDPACLEDEPAFRFNQP